MLFWEAFRFEVEKMTGKNEMNAKIIEELAKRKRRRLEISRRKKSGSSKKIVQRS
jgi:hypothetical protein